MERSVKSQKLLEQGKRYHAQNFKMVLRSGEYNVAADDSADLNPSRYRGSPTHHSVDGKSLQHTSHHEQQHVHHHHNHLHEHQHFHVSNHLHRSLEEQSHKSIGASRRTKVQHTQFSGAENRQNRQSYEQQKQQSYSDYSSGVDDFDTDSEEEKTDYTYAKSGSYCVRVPSNVQCPSPNMSRHSLRTRRNNSSFHSSEESAVIEDDSLFKSQSQYSSVDKNFLWTSTPNVFSRGLVNTNSAFHRNKEGQTSFFESETSEDYLTRSHSFWSWCSSFLSHTVYNFICSLIYVDSFILSRCCGSRSRKIGVLLLFLLLPLLYLLQSSSVASSFNTNYLTHYLSGLSPKSSQSSLESSLSEINVKEAQRLHVLWQSEMEKKLQEELERKWLEQSRLFEGRWLQQMQQLENWQGSVSDKINSIDLQLVKDEVSRMKLSLEEQLRKSDDNKQFTKDDLRIILERLSDLEEKQKHLEMLILDLEKCCKKQEFLPAGVTREELALQLNALAQEVRANLSQLVLLQSTVSTNSNHVENVHFAHKFNSSQFTPTLGEIEKIIKIALDRYDADKTGLVDYALESAGGSVVSTRCTESYPQGTAQFSLFGVPFWYSANTPRTVIQPQVHPGECWAMRGTSGYLVIQLSANILPTAFSLEHIPKELSPTGKIDSAPKEFSVYGLSSEKDTDGVPLGNFKYLDDGEPLQKFNIQNSECGTFSIVELRVHSNHGNPDYTCLYRFRVHGIRQ